MARLDPFPGIRYAVGSGVLDDLVAPPYDVVSDDERVRLEARSRHNAVHVELPRDDGERDRYEVAAGLFGRWRDERVLEVDPPSLYVYRMRYDDEAGHRRSTIGVIGALALSQSGGRDILPHERTTPKDKADRLEILRATGVNLSPIWGLSATSGLSARLGPLTRPTPDARATEDTGVVHELWRVDDPAVVDDLRDTVAGGPVLIADGHHRFEVAVAHRDEAGAGAAGAGALMAYVVELSDDQLWVQAVHRLLTGASSDELLEAFGPYFEVLPVEEEVDVGILSRMAEVAALCLIGADGAWLLRPTARTEESAEHRLDSSRLDVALAAVPAVEVRFQHGVEEVRAAVDKGEVDAAVLLRPATVAQIAEVSRGGARMPPKTTFFYPKPRTGMVFRSLAG